MELYGHIPNLSHFKAKRILYLMGLVVIIPLFFQSLMLPYGNALRSLLSYANEDIDLKLIGEKVLNDSSAWDDKEGGAQAFERSNTSMENVTVGVGNLAKESGEEVPLWKEESGSLHLEKVVPENNQSSSGDQSELMGSQVSVGNESRETDSESGKSGEGFPLLKEESEISHLEKIVPENNQSSSGTQSELMGSQVSTGNGSRETDFASSKSGERVPLLKEESENLHLEKIVPENNQSSSGNQSELMGSQVSIGNGSRETDPESENPTLGREDSLIESVPSNDSESKLGSLDGDKGGDIVKESEGLSSEDETELPHDNFVAKGKPSTVLPSGIPPNSVVTVGRMNQILAGYLKSSLSMKPKWAASPRDMEILDAKSKIINARVTQNTEDLYGPLFHNVSMFMRSYELMERTLKVYVYRDGEKPIFHQPVLKGLYASEGWFMKQMEANKHFVVKDPKRAHLFYMPFSSRMLEHTLYVPNSYNHTNLIQFMKEYSNKIATKYPYWNRTGGMDHFLVACHDWALYETEHMKNCIRALCNADVTAGYKLGWDVSLPETFIRFARNPLRDVGGRPPSERNILAFYSGNNHGYLRPLLLKHLKDRHADMRIYGPLPRGVAKRMSYIKHMKSSKYCLCPRGYEVNSPRIVEAIFYECVPVIISDNFVPPLFEVLNWETFSVLVSEKDVPRLREILVEIPEERYLEMQLAVRKVQRHFLWHPRPLKYDLFHMTLHSIWLSRVFQTNPDMRVKIG